MNIYNNSTIGTNTYPTNATFTSIETANLQIDSTFVIQGSQKGGLLVCEDNSNDIGQIDIGLQNMVLASDASNTGLPIWTNSVTLNTGTFNGLNLVGVANGDLIVGSGTNSIGRLPIGSDDQVLFSNGTTAGWQSLSALNNYTYYAGASNNVPAARGVIFNNTSFGLTNGRRYKLSLSGRLITTTQTLIYITVNSVTLRDSIYTSNGDCCISVIFTSATTSTASIDIEGEVFGGGASSLQQVYLMIEEF